MSRGTLKPYALGTDESNLIWHPISQCAVSRPKISSITVEVDELYRWESDWLWEHERHADPPCPDDDPDAGEEYIGEYYRYGPLPDYDPDYDGESVSETRQLHLLECCGTTRPRGVISSVVVKPSPGNEFITVHDYISTLHPFLLARRGDLLAYEAMCDHADSAPPDLKLFVAHHSLDDLHVQSEDKWADSWKESEHSKRTCKLADDTIVP